MTTPEPITTDEAYVAYVLEGAKAAYFAIPQSMRRSTLEAYQAQELRNRALLKETGKTP